MNTIGRPLTQDYFNFILARERFYGKFETLDEIIKMTKSGMDIYDAVQYQIDKTNEQKEQIHFKQRYYEGV